MSVTKISRAFKDISLSFQPHPVTKDLPVLINENAIMKSVRNLVETMYTERFFDSNLGSSLRNSIFDIIDVRMSVVIEDEIKRVIKNYEPRVSNILVKVDLEPDKNQIGITVNYEIVGQQSPAQTFTFILEATR